MLIAINCLVTKTYTERERKEKILQGTTKSDIIWKWVELIWFEIIIYSWNIEFVFMLNGIAFICGNAYYCANNIIWRVWCDLLVIQLYKQPVNFNIK